MPSERIEPLNDSPDVFTRTVEVIERFVTEYLGWPVGDEVRAEAVKLAEELTLARVLRD